MSRTFRHIPYHARYVQPYEKTWAGLGVSNIEWDDRSALYNGYDGVSQSYIYERHPPHGWPDNYVGNSRRFYKRRYHKDRRRFDKRELQKFLKEEDAV